MTTDDTRITTSPFMPFDPLKYAAQCGPEGGWRPLDDGSFPVYPFEFTNWVDEELSWYDNCYIHAGLNPFLFYDVHGKGLLDLFTDISVNTFNKFPVGKCRHTILCNNDGKVMVDGILVRRSEEDFITMCLPDPAMLAQMTGKDYGFTSKDTCAKRSFFQLCGPRSLEVVEQAAKTDLHDLEFMYLVDAKIADKDVFILRTSMAGTLGYEVHGMVEDAHEVYECLMEMGKEYGITELGRHAYRNAHTEGSIPQVNTHWPAADFPFPIKVTGSLDPASELVYRSPVDLGWEGMVNFGHEFPGKAAIQAELEGHHNSMVTLVWDKADVLKAIEASMDPENPTDVMDMVEDYDPVGGNMTVHIDGVYDGSKLVGAASGRMLSPKTREMISLCTIDQDYAEQGKVVEVLWGTPGKRQVRIKATVDLFPYIKEGRNLGFDIESIPHPIFE